MPQGGAKSVIKSPTIAPSVSEGVVRNTMIDRCIIFMDDAT